MKIIADEEIPNVAHYFSHCGEITLRSGRHLKRQDLLEADLLIIRSVTQVNQALLEGTPVRFVGSTVTGLDHMDVDWLTQQGIGWTNANGCNSLAVADYVISVVAALQKNKMLSAKKLRAGVIGVGNIGTQVVSRLKALDFDVIQYDPIRAANEADFESTSLNDFVNLDLITIHTPLTREKPFPTFHMIEKNFLERQKRDCILLNTSRGAVINSADLMQYGHHLKWCLDVWENEPTIDLKILEKTLIATQHIAGHSIQAKYRGIKMIYERACEMGVIPAGNLTSIDYPRRLLSLNRRMLSWRDIVLEVINPLADTDYVKTMLLNSKKTFDQLRKEYTLRHEFRFVDVEHVEIRDEDKVILKMLGMNRV